MFVQPVGSAVVAQGVQRDRSAETRECTRTCGCALSLLSLRLRLAPALSHPPVSRLHATYQATRTAHTNATACLVPGRKRGHLHEA